MEFVCAGESDFFLSLLVSVATLSAILFLNLLLNCSESCAKTFVYFSFSIVWYLSATEFCVGKNWQYFWTIYQRRKNISRLDLQRIFSFFCQIRNHFCWCRLWYRDASLVANCSTYWGIYYCQKMFRVICETEEHYLRACRWFRVHLGHLNDFEN